ncbi:MAG: ACT domain-containing protein [Chloroflexota bacterium]
MERAKRVKQLTFMMPDRPGLLADVSAAIAAAKVNIASICAYAMEDTATFMLVTDGNAKAKKVIAKMGADVTEQDVVVVEMPNRPGELEKVAEKVAQGNVNIHYLYGTSSSGKTGNCVFSSADDKKAIRLINK